jgi:hypothetical protein
MSLKEHVCSKDLLVNAFTFALAASNDLYLHRFEVTRRRPRYNKICTRIAANSRYINPMSDYSSSPGRQKQMAINR